MVTRAYDEILGYRQTGIETAATVTPDDVSKKPGDSDRYQSLADAVAVCKGPNYKLKLAPVTEAITAALSLTLPTVIEGDGCNNALTLGSIIENTTNDVNAIHVIGATTSLGQRCEFRRFGVIHEAATKAAIKIERGPYVIAENLVLQGNGLGGVGMLFGSDQHVNTADLSANSQAAFSSVIKHVRVDDMAIACFDVNSEGHTYKFEECSPRTNVAGSHGYRISAQNCHIYGGQSAATGAGGIAVYFLNRRNAAIRGGSVQNQKFEGVTIGKYAVVIDGTTDLFFDVIGNRCGMQLSSNAGTLIKFGRAQNCWLIEPDIAAPTGGGILAEWGEFSVDCGILVDFQSARAPVTVHASATRALKVVKGRIAAADVADITTATNLTVILQHGIVGLPGITPVHNGVSWNYVPSSPAQIVANTDNYNPTGLGHNLTFRLSTDASRNLTGIVAQAGGTRMLLCNVGGFDIVLVHDATSTAANRFLCPGSANYNLNTNDSVFIGYDATSSRWRVLAA